MLDLGRVADIGEILVNGKSIATLWAPPFRADIPPFVPLGKNDLSIKVINTWFNRLTYDPSLPKDQQKTWTIKAPQAKSPPQARRPARSRHSPPGRNHQTQLMSRAHPAILPSS